MVLQPLKLHNLRMGQSITLGNTPLQLAVRHSNSEALIKELIQIHPPALRMLNNDTLLDFQNRTPMAPNILRAFLPADPELNLIQNKQHNDELPIHCYFGENPNVLKFLSILLQTSNDLVNVSTWDGMLPIHIAASCSTLEVMQLLYKYSSSSSINVIAPGWWALWLI